MDIKRAFDIAASATGITILSPVLGVLSLASLVHFRASPFHAVDRVGKDGKTFSMLKLRSMHDLRNEDGNFLPDEDRMTGFGKFLRATALDELPQLMNIFKGDMSFVGPRPLAAEEYENVPDSYRNIFSVRPGLTGPWQVAAIGKKEPLSHQERLDLDRSYAQNKPTLTNDMRLILRTLPAFIKGHDGETLQKRKLDP